MLISLSVVVSECISQVHLFQNAAEGEDNELGR
jgi:hypothetical protein